MQTNSLNYEHEGQTFCGYIAYPDEVVQPKPAVMVMHDWTGCNDFARAKAEWLAGQGYIGFAVDMYGDGRQGETREEKSSLIQPLLEDRKKLQKHLTAALQTLQAESQVNMQKVAAMGFCFGGLCVLDLARFSHEVAGVISLHGLLNAPEPASADKISAKVLALHGYDDPMVPPEQVEAFAEEMTERGADWQLHAFGNTTHAFTNPEANDPDFGTVYSSSADTRSSLLVKNFLQEIFA